MKIIAMLLSSLFCVVGFAETIQHVEYHLPKAAASWVTGNKLENKNGSTIVYIPKHSDRKSAKEFFGVNGNSLASDLNDLSGIKSELSKQFPKMALDFKVLEKHKDSVIYEWAAKEHGREKAHGWGRVFSNKDGTVVLGYQTENMANVAQARSIWLPVLQAAKSG